jgi:HAE1 family hydrophobic/amphiphilic exporter-1
MAEGPAMNESALGFSGFYINDDFSPQYGNNLGHVAVTLPKKNARKFADYPRNDIIAHLEYIRDKVAPLVPPGTSLSIRPEKDGPPAGKDLNIRTLGTDPENIFRLAEAVKDTLVNDPDIAPWLVDLQDDRGSTGRVFKIDIDHARAAEFGIPVSEIARMASAIINGQVIGEMKLIDEQIDIKVKMQLTGDLPMTEVLDMVVAETPAGRVPLSDLCTAEYSIEPGSLNRFKNQRAITLMADIKPGAPISSQMVVRTVREFYAGVQDHYPGAVLNFSGEHESTKKSFISLSYAFVIALLMIYIVLAAQFRSYLQPLIIISAVVFALTGVVYGTFVSRTLFTINSFVAIVGVTGVVVNDSLVLVAFLNNCYRSGLNRKDALLLATNIRLRPILLTTITTTLGLLPMALGIPEYSLVWGSMAMTFVTGLCTATILTIMVVPVQWDLLVGLREKYRGQESEENYLSDR